MVGLLLVLVVIVLLLLLLFGVASHVTRYGRREADRLTRGGRRSCEARR